MKLGIIITLTGLVVLMAATAPAQVPTVPKFLDFQGDLGGGGGTRNMVFNIYDNPDPALGTRVWTETHLNVPVAAGLFRVNLGSIANNLDLAFFPTNAAGNTLRWLEVIVNGTPLTPTIPIVSLPYAFRASDADTLDGLSTNAFVKVAGDIMTGSLTMNPNQRIWGTNIIYSQAIFDGTITNDDIDADADIDGDKIKYATTTTTGTVRLATSTYTAADRAVQASDTRLSDKREPKGSAGGDLTGDYPNPTIKDSAVTSGKINDGAVATADIADGAVTTAKIDDGDVTSAKINDSAVTTAKINDSAVTTAKINDSAVTSGKINDGTIADADIAANANIAGSKISPVFDSLEVRRNDDDSRLLFLDPGDQSYSMGMDRSDGLKFKINRGGILGENNDLTIDAAGNVGLGTTGPGDKLDVAGNIRASLYADRDNPNYFVNPAGGSRTGRIDADYLYSYDWIYGTIFYDGNNSSFYLDPASVSYLNDVRADVYYDRNNTGYYVDPAGVSYLNDMRASIYYDRDNPGYYLNPNSDSSLLNIYSSYIRNYGNLHVDGKVGIGTTPSPFYKLHVNGSAQFNDYVNVMGSLMAWANIRTESIKTIFAYDFYNPLFTLRATDSFSVLVPPKGGFRVTDYTGGARNNLLLTESGNLYIDKDVYARGVKLTSDGRTKFDQRPLNYGLVQIMALGPKRYESAEYEYNLETEELVIHPEKTTNDIGLVAQEVFEVIPEAVVVPEDENSVWAMSYSTIIPVLVKAIQEQQAQIEALKQDKQALAAPVTSTDIPLTADFDGDDRTDRSLVSASGDWYFWLSGSGFVKIGPYNFGITGKPVVADFDNDGKADPGIVSASGEWYAWLSASGYSQSKL